MRRIRKPIRKVKKSRKSPGGRKLAASMRGISVTALSEIEKSEATQQSMRAAQKKAAALAAAAGAHEPEKTNA
jgi:hypothetical protein